VAIGVPHSVRDFVATAFRAVGIEDWQAHVTLDPALHRPADAQLLVGDAARLRAIGWAPGVDFDGLVELMVAAERESGS
jgi:GDPmannose 4,6-dehydratase